jgi:hypothetical protein
LNSQPASRTATGRAFFPREDFAHLFNQGAPGLVTPRNRADLAPG